MSQSSTEEVKDEGQEELSETPADLSMYCTEIQMKSLSSNAEVLTSTGQQKFPVQTPLCRVPSWGRRLTFSEFPYSTP